MYKQKVYISLFLISLFIVFNPKYLYSQSATDSLFFNKVIVALQQADAAGISKVVYKKVDVTLPNQSGIYSPYQLQLILKDFFDTIQLDTFICTNQYKRANENFIVGKIKGKDKYYRICLLTKLMSDQNYIYQIRVEK